MKKFCKYFLPLLLVIALAFVTGCKKDKDEPVTFESLSFTEEEIIDRIPEGLKNSTDENAQACVDAIETAADWSLFYDDLTPPENAVKVNNKSTSSEGTWKWTYNYDGVHTITYYWTFEETSTQNKWTLEIQWDDGPIFDFINAWELKDGTQGEVKYNFEWACGYEDQNYDECYDLYWIYTWNKSANGVINFTFLYESYEVEYQYYYKYELVLNPDGSGTLDWYWLDDYWHYHYEWDAQGNGSWVWYSEGGIINGSGSWTV